ncbi:hypothetical protein TNCV_4523301 [Trichonephila clavipes]|nr:hypothetical protein TNCV_4523301 [Trichonephila clavipes]
MSKELVHDRARGLCRAECSEKKLCPLELDICQVVNKSRETINPGGNSERFDCVPTIPDYVPIVPDSGSTIPDSDVATTRSGRNIRTPNRYIQNMKS